MLPDHLGGSAGGLVAATMAELDVAGVLNTSRGQGALVLARRLEAGGLDTGSSVAAMVAGLRAAMDSALDSAVAVDDPLDMLAKKRVERLAHG